MKNYLNPMFLNAKLGCSPRLFTGYDGSFLSKAAILAKACYGRSTSMERGTHKLSPLSRLASYLALTQVNQGLCGEGYRSMMIKLLSGFCGRA